MKLGILSDIHEDFIGLNKAITISEKEGCDKLFCLGDLVGYSSRFYQFADSRSAIRVVDMIRKNCDHAIAGNHDLYACKRIPQSASGFDYPENWYNLPLNERKRLAKDSVWLYEGHDLPNDLTAEGEKYLKQLPEYSLHKYGNYKFLFSHFLYPDLTGSSTKLIPDRNMVKKHQEFMHDQNAQIALIGHMHPEGLWTYKKNRIKHLRFGIHSIHINQQIFGVPCIANGHNRAGITVLDTMQMTIKTIPLRPRKFP